MMARRILALTPLPVMVSVLFLLLLIVVVDECFVLFVVDCCCFCCYWVASSPEPEPYAYDSIDDDGLEGVPVNPYPEVMM